MKTKKRNKKRVVISIAGIVAALFIGNAIISAVIDDSNAVHINAAEIENSTLIIGTHLIYLGSMNDQIYETAMKSAEEANQYKMYYKSELSGGTWYEISEASVLADITTEGIIVTDAEIQALFMTHHTKSDGITYDLFTNSSVCLFDIEDPYDLEGLDELEPIKLQYDMLVQNEDPSDTMARDMLYIQELYNKDRTTALTQEYDAAMDALQAYYEILVRDEADSAYSDMVMKVMDKFDAARRAEILAPLNETELQNLSQAVGRDYAYVEGAIIGTTTAPEQEDANGDGTADEDDDAAADSEEEDEGDRVENFSANTELLNAISDAIANVQESYIEHSSNMLAEGTTVLSKAEYQLANELVSNAKAQNYSGCDVVVEKLIYLDNVNNSVIQDGEKERGYISEDLIVAAEDAYKASLGAGVSETYQSLSSTAAAATRAKVLKDQMNETEIVRNELQFILQAYMDRLPAEDAIAYTSQRIDNLDDFSDVVKSDAYQEYADNSIDAHLQWLTSTLAALQESLGGGEMDALMAEKNELQDELLAALDDNKFDEANRIEAEIEALDKELEDLEDELNDILNSDTATDAEKAMAEAQLGAGSASAAIQDMKNNALEDLKEGDLEGVDNVIDAIAELAAIQPQSALNALKDIYEETSAQSLLSGSSGTNAFDTLMDKVETVTAEHADSLNPELSENDIADLVKGFIEQITGSELDDSGTGFGDNNGAGIGVGIGDGTGDGSGDESGDGAGDGSGDGTGDGSGDGNGDGTGDGNGDGSGDGTGDGSGDGSGDGTGDGNGDGTGDGSGNESGAATSSALNSVLGALSNDQLGAIFAGMNQYVEETGSDKMNDLLELYARIALSTGNGYIFHQYRGDYLSEYAPTSNIAQVTGYRYIFNDSQKSVTLQKRTDYYKFKAFGIEAQKGTEAAEMSKAAGFQGVIYIPEDAVETYFSLTVEYLNGSSYGLLLTEEMEELGQEFFEFLLEAGEVF